MKSWVSLEQKICAVCVQQYDSGALLLNKRLSESMDEKNRHRMGNVSGVSTKRG